MDESFSAARCPAAESPALQPRRLAPLTPWADLDADLAEFETTPQGRRLATLEADQAVMLALSVEGFDGRAWQTTAETLIEYGWAVMTPWISSGLVFVKCREKGIAGPLLRPPNGGIAYSDARELAEDTVAEAVVSFRRQVECGRWNPALGASLSTYFIGNCLRQFANRYRKWHSERLRQIPSERVIDVRAVTDPAQVLYERERASELLALLDDPVNRTIVQLVADEYSISDIAHLLDLTYKQVESRLYRSRKRLQRQLKKVG